MATLTGALTGLAMLAILDAVTWKIVAKVLLVTIGIMAKDALLFLKDHPADEALDEIARPADSGSQVMKVLLFLVVALAVCGCAHVPATTFSLNPKTGAVTIASPKEIDMQNVIVSVEGQRVNVNIGHYSSKNSPDVIAAVAAQNAATAQSAIALSQMAIQAGLSAAAKAAAP